MGWGGIQMILELTTSDGSIGVVVSDGSKDISSWWSWWFQVAVSGGSCARWFGR